MDEKEKRDAFNMKVLKRHDPDIIDIVGSAAFVVLYEHDEEWTKLGIEGPMFLYRRSTQPAYGFFVLNRNGVDNFSADLTPKDDLELTSEFIIYRASSDDQVLGVWVYDAKERDSIGSLMVNLHSASSAPPSHPTVQASSSTAGRGNVLSGQSQAGQSIDLDTLFGSRAPQVQPALEQPPPSGPALLDSIFQSAAPRPPPAAQSTFAKANDGRAADQSADGLKSLLGLPSAPPSAPSQQSSRQGGALPQGLEAIFASARISPQAPAQQMTPLPLQQRAEVPSSLGNPQPLTNSTGFAAVASAALDGNLSHRSKSETVLDRSDFVREVLSLIHTDKAFVDDLYQRYLSRVR